MRSNEVITAPTKELAKQLAEGIVERGVEQGKSSHRDSHYLPLRNSPKTPIGTVGTTFALFFGNRYHLA